MCMVMRIDGLKNGFYLSTRVNKVGIIFLLVILLLNAGPVQADQLRVAVASNFAETLKQISAGFESATDHEVKLVVGSTGKHYAQIHNGAPFDAFFAADVKRPKLLDEAGIAKPGSRFTYALGALVLWSPFPGLIDGDGDVLKQGEFRHLAIANPKLAPYGRAAEEVLKSKGLWAELRRRMVRGENIGQAYQFVSSGNAELGFVALSQVRRIGEEIAGSYWLVPSELYSPIKQQAVQLTRGAAVDEFMAYVRSEEAQKIIHAYGYMTP